MCHASAHSSVIMATSPALIVAVDGSLTILDVSRYETLLEFHLNSDGVESKSFIARHQEFVYKSLQRGAELAKQHGESSKSTTCLLFPACRNFKVCLCDPSL